MPYIFGFVSQKGGVGKSTFARAAAVALAKSEYRVKLCDPDVQQGSTIDWYRRRLQHGAAPLASVQSYRSVEDALGNGLDMPSSFDAIVIDAAGRSSEATLKLAQNAHILIQPTSGTLDDLDPSIRLFHDLRNKGISPRKLVLALSRTTTDAEQEMAREYVSQTGYLMLKTAIPDRSGYKLAQNVGNTILETSFPSLNERAEALVQELLDFLQQ
jgi:chromosome partitioning protein